MAFYLIQVLTHGYTAVIGSASWEVSGKQHQVHKGPGQNEAGS